MRAGTEARQRIITYGVPRGRARFFRQRAWQRTFDIRRLAPILYKYTVSGATMNFEYRQCYQPQPSLRLPSWMRRLWVWL